MSVYNNPNQQYFSRPKSTIFIVIAVILIAFVAVLYFFSSKGCRSAVTYNEANYSYEYQNQRFETRSDALKQCREQSLF